MNDGSERRVATHLAVTREKRLRRLGRISGPIFSLPLLLLGMATWFGSERDRPVFFALFLFATVIASILMLTVPPLLSWLIGSNYRGPLLLSRDRQELSLIGPEGRRRWTVALADIGVAWLRAPQLMELATAQGDEASITFGSYPEAARTVASLREQAHRDRRAYPLGLESDSARLFRQTFAWYTPSALAMVLLTLGPMAWPVAPIALALGWLGAHGTRRVVLGADGLIIETRFRRRYVPYREIVKVKLSATLPGLRALTLHLTDGRRVRLATLVNAARADLAKALIEEGMRMVERGEAAGASVGSLAGETEEAGDWRLRLRGVAHKSGYRGAALDVDRLISIVRNPAAEAAHRIAAALALRAEPAGVARLRVAADVSAEPEVREALEALATDAVDERRVERVLRRLSSRS